jgi:hypothetical protein
MFLSGGRRIAITCAVALASFSGVVVQAQGRGGAGPGPVTAQSVAPPALAGYWVAVISEDWRFRMVTPAKGDYASIPLTPEGLKAADTWDPARDEAAGEQCRSYGAPGLMRTPTRLNITWLDANTLKVETDYGIQTRLFRFGDAASSEGPPTWQGESRAQWLIARGRGANNQRLGTMKAVTTRLRPGYLRKNGVPYSADTVLTEYWDTVAEANGDQWLVITSMVTDPVNLQAPFTTALHFKKEVDGSKWHPTPCSARW